MSEVLGQNVVSDFRLAVIAQLEASFPAAEIRSGRRSGVSRDKDRINVFFEGWQIDAERAVLARPTLIVRYWKAMDETPPPDSPQDPTELEQGSIDLLQALRQIQDLSTIGRPWFFFVESVKIDEDPLEWGIEARLTGFTTNLATIA